jgi:GDP-L-fucose synthase
MIKVLVTGSNGLVGMNLRKEIDGNVLRDYTRDYHFTFSSRKDTDLLQKSEVFSLFENTRPDIVIHLASIVGGLFYNQENNEKMLNDNNTLNNNVIDACEKYKIKFGIFILSTCIFPDELAINSLNIPMNELDVHKGNPHNSNSGYAISKRNIDIRLNECSFKSTRLIPSNLYGPFDLFDPLKSHVIPALIYKFSKNKEHVINLRGSPHSTRQFVYVKDLCKIIIDILLNHYTHSFDKLVIANECVSIGKVTEILADSLGKPKIEWSNLEEGQTHKKCCTLYPEYFEKFTFTPLTIGLSETIEYFKTLDL